jgi:hypothetical protein
VVLPDATAHCRSEGLGFCRVGLCARRTSSNVPAAPTPVYIAQRVGGPPTMDRLGAPDQGAIHREAAGA